MDSHGLNGACMYINDFKNWYSEDNVSQDIMKFIKDRFSACSEQQKNELYNIFNKLADRISSQEENNIDTFDIVSELVDFLDK